MLVDDHEFFRKGLGLVINNSGFAEVAGEAGDGTAFLEQLEKIRPDLVFMDINMPGMNGTEATRKALEKYPDLKIIALTMFGEEAYLMNMIEAGVSGFLLKTIKQADLERAIRIVAAGNQYYSEELLAHFTKRIADPNDEKPKISPREAEILQCMVKGMSNHEIANQLFISERTVNVHKYNLMQKTASRNAVELVIFAIRNRIVEI